MSIVFFTNFLFFHGEKIPLRRRMGKRIQRCGKPVDINEKGEKNRREKFAQFSTFSTGLSTGKPEKTPENPGILRGRGQFSTGFNRKKQNAALVNRTTVKKQEERKKRVPANLVYPDFPGR